MKNQTVVALHEKFLEKRDLHDGLGKTSPGFSDRLNQMIDLTELDAPTVGHGRFAWISKIAGVVKSTGAEWLAKDKPPREPTLSALVDYLLGHLKGTYDVTRVKIWLLYGEDVVPFPFQPQAEDQRTFLQLALVVIHEETNREKIAHTDYDYDAVVERVTKMFQSLNVDAYEDVKLGHRSLVVDCIRDFSTPH